MPALHAFFLMYPDIDLEVIATRDILDLAVWVRIFRNFLVETLEQQRDRIKGRGIAHTTSERA
ncbi:MAG: hypothetical protein WBN51_08200 [Gammaproteobacteria bacterium]